MDELIVRVERGLSEFAAGRYDEVITLLSDQVGLSLRERAILGISLLRLAHFAEAEPVLLRANLQGDPEAQVEYGNLLRATGRFSEARQHLEFILPAVKHDPDLHLRCLRWLGTAEFQSGLTDEGIKRIELVWHAYLARNDEMSAARVAQPLAVFYETIGQTNKAITILKSAISILSNTSNVLPLLAALQSLVNLQISVGHLDEAQATLDEALEITSGTTSLYPRAHLLASQADLLLVHGEYGKYVETLKELKGLARQIQDYELTLFSTVRLAEHLSRVGLHGYALQELLRFPKTGSEEPVQLTVLRGVLSRRRGDVRTSIGYLRRGIEILEVQGRKPELTRAQLQLAFSHYLARDEAATIATMQQALSGLMELHAQTQFKPELEELAELLQFAALEPDLAPYLEPVLSSMEQMGGIAGAPSVDAGSPATHLEINTFGSVRVTFNGTPLHFSYKGGPLILAHLALKPNRTRAEIEEDIFTHRGGDGGAYFRSAVKELRDLLGNDVLVMEGPHKAPRYRLGRHLTVDLDYQRLYDALNVGEITRALGFYRGDFFADWTDGEWVDERREEARNALAFELRVQITGARDKEDWRRMLLLCNQLLRVDPLDAEVLAERVEAAREAGAKPEDLARYTAELRQFDN